MFKKNVAYTEDAYRNGIAGFMGGDMPEKITKGQIRAIWAKARVLDLSEDELRDIVQRIRGRSRRISTMTYEQASRVLDLLEEFFNVLEERHNRITRKQLWKIRVLGEEIFGEERRFLRWLNRKFKVSHPIWFDRVTASKVIEIMMRLKERGYRVGVECRNAN